MDVSVLLASMSLPECESLVNLLDCSMETCGTDEIEPDIFCLMEDLLYSSCM